MRLVAIILGIAALIIGSTGLIGAATPDPEVEAARAGSLCPIGFPCPHAKATQRARMDRADHYDAWEFGVQRWIADKDRMTSIQLWSMAGSRPHPMY